MANTPNLNLEEISLDDNIKTDFINKLNNNSYKLDTAYGNLVDNLLENTGKDTLVEAIEEVNNLADRIDELEELVYSGDATSNDIRSGKTALVQGETITGSIVINDCYVSTSEPTSADGNNGDLWLVVEA